MLTISLAVTISVAKDLFGEATAFDLIGHAVDEIGALERISQLGTQ